MPEAPGLALPRAGPKHPLRVAAGLRSVCAADVIPRPVDWLWRPRIALGAITVLVGVPGVGKSLLAAHLAASGSRGDGDVDAFCSLLVGGEDSLEHVVRPRLEAADADLTRIHLVDEPLSFPGDESDLDSLVAETAARLVVIDPLSAYFARHVNSWKDDSIRTALTPLQQIASRHHAAVVLVAHLNKGQDTDPLRRIGGSVGLAAIARSALLLGRAPDDPDGDSGARRVLAHIKSNLGEPAASLLYTIHEHTIGPITTARLREEGAVGFDGRDLLNPEPNEGRSALHEACEFLHQQLARGAQPVKDVEAAAAQVGISDSTLKRARRTLKIKPKKTDRGWLLHPPSTTATSNL
jgi:putative DNA primase/helicase